MPWRLPHARGDRPVIRGLNGIDEMASPRSWGSTAQFVGRDQHHVGFPTLVGIDPRL